MNHKFRKSEYYSGDFSMALAENYAIRSSETICYRARDSDGIGYHVESATARSPMDSAMVSLAIFSALKTIARGYCVKSAIEMAEAIVEIYSDNSERCISTLDSVYNPIRSFLIGV